MPRKAKNKSFFFSVSVLFILTLFFAPCVPAQQQEKPTETQQPKTEKSQQTTDEKDTTVEDEIPVEEDEEVEKPDSVLPVPDGAADAEDNSTGELEQFELEFAELKDKVDSLTRSPNDYKEFYFRLRPVIEENVARFKKDLLSPRTDLSLFAQINNDEYFQHLFEQAIAVKNLFYLREKIFNEAPPEFVALHTSTRLDGIKEARLEASYIQLELIILGKASYDRFTEIPKRFEVAPLDLIINIFKLILLITIFYIWRSWAKKGLPKWRERILSKKPVTSGKRKYARFVWYLDKTRSPIEWYVFILILLASIDVLQIPFLKATISTIAFWMCLTVFIFKLLEKMIERGKQALLKGIEKGQSRSIKLFIWWIGLFMMADSLMTLFIGEVTIYAWLSRLFYILFIPVYLYLIAKWRQDAFDFVAEERDAPDWIKRVHQQQKGLKGFISANICLAYTIYVGSGHMFLQLISKAETGKRFTTEIYRKKLISDNQDAVDEHKQLPDIDTQLKDRLIKGNGVEIESVHSEHISTIKDMLENRDYSHVAVIGERGIGKTFFLNSLTKISEHHLRFDCRKTFDELLEDLAQQLDISVEQAVEKNISQIIYDRGIRMILMDNCHLLLSPKVSGQQQLRKLSSWINELSGKCLCILTFNSSSWPLVKALGLAPDHYSRTITLEPWSQSQIEGLLKQRCKNNNIQPDFTRLIIPKQLSDNEEDESEKRNMSGMYRIIWGYADGNPAISTRLFADSLAVDNGKVIVKLPSYPDTSLVETYEISTLLLLRVICQFGEITLEEIKDNLTYRNFAVKSALANCQAHGMVDKVDNKYTISWLWFRSVSRYLSRQNLLIR